MGRPLGVVRAEDDSRYHFFGTLLSVDSYRSASSQSAPLELLDGQQRFATFTLLMVAIDRQLEEIEGSLEASAAVREAARQARQRLAEAIVSTPGG